MFHSELFSSSIASGANTFAQINYSTALNTLQSSGNGMLVPVQLSKLMWIAGVGAHLVHLRVQAPSLQPLPYIALSPGNRGSALESPPRLFDFSKYPIPFRPLEELDIFATQNAGAGETQYALVTMTDANFVPPPALRTGPTINGNNGFFTLHGTASTTLTAGGWTAITPTLDQGFPSGLFSLVGVRVFSATALFFRVKPTLEPLWKPGGVAVQAYDQLDPIGQRAFNRDPVPFAPWGEWLKFYSTNVPQIEIFATAADTAEEAWFDCVKVSDATVQGSF